MNTRDLYFDDEEPDDRYHHQEYKDENETRMMERLNSRIIWEDPLQFLNYRGQRVG